MEPVSILLNNQSNYIEYRIIFPPTKIQYYHTPTSVLQALSKVGGLIAVFKVGLVLKIIHEMRFETKISRAYGKNKQKAESQSSTRRASST
jgi:hypothetical protein